MSTEKFIEIQILRKKYAVSTLRQRPTKDTSTEQALTPTYELWPTTQ